MSGFQTGEGPSVALLYDCENRWIVCSSSQANHTKDCHSTPHLVCGGLVLSSADSNHLLELFEGQPLSAEFLGQVGNLNITDESMTEVQGQCV